MKKPLISVIMSAYNSERTLLAALESIEAQTYGNWELIVCDDGSSDGTDELLKRVAKRYVSHRVIILTNATNRKLAYSLNRCLEAASGDFIARMDADDLSEPDRFIRQLQFLADNPDVDLVGTAMRRFNTEGLGDIVYPAAEAPDRTTPGRTSRAPFAHATIMARRSVFDAVGNYTVAWRTARAEDLDLWYKFFAAGLVGRNIPEPLYLVREDRAALRRRTAKSRFAAYVTMIYGYRMLRTPPWAYFRATISLLKILVPYRVFDWHRQLSRTRALARNSEGPSE